MAVERKKNSSVSKNIPPGSPHDLQYDPRFQSLSLMQTSHSSMGIGSPGFSQIPSLLWNSFWWANMARDIRKFDIRKSIKHPSDSISVRTWLLTTVSPIVWGNRPRYYLWITSSRKAWVSWDSAHKYLQEAIKGSCWCMADLKTILSTQAKEMALNKGHPVTSSLQDTESLIHRPIWDWELY